MSEESPAPPPPDPWDATWEGARRHLLRSTLLASPAQRLAWLEEMLELAYRAGALGSVVKGGRGGKLGT